MGTPIRAKIDSFVSKRYIAAINRVGIGDG